MFCGSLGKESYSDLGTQHISIEVVMPVKSPIIYGLGFGVERCQALLLYPSRCSVQTPNQPYNPALCHTAM